MTTKTPAPPTRSDAPPGGWRAALGHYERSTLLVAGLAVVVVVSLLLLEGGFTGQLVTQMLVFAIAAMGVGFLGGYGGMVSLGQASFLGLGAYGVAVPMADGADPWTAVLISLVVTLVVALLTGLLAVRVRGISFVIMTLALGQILFGLASSWVDLSGGDNGLIIPFNPELGPLDFNDPLQLSFAVLVIFLLAALALRTFVASPFGLALQGIKSNEQRLKTLGYATLLHLYLSWVISVMFAGVAGILFVFTNGLITPTAMDYGHNGIVTLMAVIGGLGTLWGPAVGSVIVLLFQQYASLYFERWSTLMGIVFVSVVIFAPEGVWGLAKNLARRVVHKPSPPIAEGIDSVGLAEDAGAAPDAALPDPTNERVQP
jgi:branched-chain amino acid transport system permease protein